MSAASVSEQTLESSGGNSVAVLMPVYNDWDCIGTLLRRLDDSLAAKGLKAGVLLVDDNSSQQADAYVPGQENFLAIQHLEVLRLRCNLGHQRAISLGLCHLAKKKLCAPVVVMDADGEDRPEDVPALWDAFQKSGGRKVVFAARMKRMEGAAFRIGYHCYRFLHWLLTGVAVRVGNFSICPWHVVQQLTVRPELWNHYAACIYHSNISYDMLPLDRGVRISGKSKMRFVNLAIHGLSAISVFTDRVAIRMLVAAAVTLGGLCMGLAAAVHRGLPGVTLVLLGGLILLAFQTLLVILAIALYSLARRSSPQIIPEQLYPYYVLNPAPQGRNK
jgi:hypothetical protein